MIHYVCGGQMRPGAGVVVCENCGPRFATYNNPFMVEHPVVVEYRSIHRLSGLLRGLLREKEGASP